jgi:lysyl-tRNA synthetase, class I
MTTESLSPSSHWADHAASDLIAHHPDKNEFVCASGISPSGVVHIGNFREVVTTEFVVRALRDKGKKVRFIYSWDDYDAFRKVPANLPNAEKLKGQLRRPISSVADPFEAGAPSYASHFERQFEKEIAELGIAPEFIYQNQAYRSCRYKEGIRHALKHEKKIIEILNAARTEPLEEGWTCISVFCKKCEKDTTEKVTYREPYEVSYHCASCKEDFTVDFSKDPGVKLLWRVDWPMRWAHEKVDFEPGGKDHSSTGGSFDTGKAIIKAVWGREAPYYVQYDFVIAKGRGSKLSSSSGNLITLGEALAVYEPEVIRWIFASRKPNLDFAIAFDLDVIKTYDDFDRTERYAFGVEPGEEKKVSYERRIYELSRTTAEPPLSKLKAPAQFSFRHLCNILQIHQGNLNEARRHYSDQITSDHDENRFHARASRAWTWITEYAPEEFRFQLRAPEAKPIKTAMPAVVGEVAALLDALPVAGVTDEELSGKLFEVMKKHGLNAKQFFPEIYFALIGKPQGPKLGSFLLAMGTKRAAQLLRSTL